MTTDQSALQKSPLTMLLTRGNRPNHPQPKPLNISRWIVMSMLQKAIRRGELRFALAAASTLLEVEPQRLWRRLGTIAFEDIGIADVDTIALVMEGLSSKKFRGELGGEWAVASCLVAHAVDAKKCRAVDDLLMIADRHPQYAKLRLDLASGDADDSLSLLKDGVGIVEKAVGVWSLAAFLRYGKSPRRQSADPFKVFDAYSAMGVPGQILRLCEQGYRKTHQLLPLLFPLIWMCRPTVPRCEDDSFPPEVVFHDVPFWAADKHTREGREAYKRFLLLDCRSANWIRKNVPTWSQLPVMGTLVFAVESGQLKRRIRWSLGDGLRDLWQRECHGQHCRDATALLDLVRDDMTLLNDVRAKCLNI